MPSRTPRRPPESPDFPPDSPDSPAPSGETPVVVSQELLAPVSGGIELCYQTFGDPDDEPLLLVMGLGGPMTWWDPELCTQLTRAGFYVVRFDNRDVGRSSRAAGKVRRTQLVRAFLGAPVRPPYTLLDMANDAFGLLDHLGLASAHVAGVSMGGMIAQTMAIAQPRRVRSLASIMSTTGKRTVGWQHPIMLRNLVLGGGVGRDAYIASSLATWQLIGSPAYPQSDDALRVRAGETYDRGVSLNGMLRQMAAIVSQPNRTVALHSVRAPTVVIHGLADKMVHVSGGRATALAVPNADLLLIDGMGHDMPAELFETFVDAVRRNASRAQGATDQLGRRHPH